MSSHALLLLLILHAVALVSPGPDCAVVSRRSIVSARRSGLWSAAGVACAIGIHVSLCALGLSVALAALPGLARVLSVVGAGYLAWLGMQCLCSRGAMPEHAVATAGGRAFVTGLRTHRLNPKAMLYFGSILSQVLTPGLGRAALLQAWALLVAESFLWFALVAGLFPRAACSNGCAGGASGSTGSSAWSCWDTPPRSRRWPHAERPLSF